NTLVKSPIPLQTPNQAATNQAIISQVVDSTEIDIQLSPLLLSLIKCYVQCMNSTGIVDIIAYNTEIIKLSQGNPLIKQAIDTQNELVNKYLKALEDLNAIQNKQEGGSCKSEILPADINMMDVRA
ncbi:hypothetical protein, partial [Salmonella sp. s51228]|uniref:hypothetical protein n=1 Tax=Salmonella sp. s51228 TaxID=3159652 RepID=UPI00397E99E9